MDSTVLIIGGGLSGLVTAWGLQKRGIDYILIEARDRFGGRILSQPLLDNANRQTSAIDLGPAWFWPGQQNMTQLIDDLELNDSVFLQASAGQSVMEYQSGKIECGQGSAAMADSYRLEGGINTLIVDLVDRLTDSQLLDNAVATGLSNTDAGISTTAIISGVAQTIESQHVVLALPPRLIGTSLKFTPALSKAAITQMNSVATWMAGQAKFAAVYPQAFWRDQGMSGDGFSQRGPLVEIHDASPRQGGPFALFGFVGVPAQHREGHSVALKQAAVEQLVRMFGKAAGEPSQVHLQDWAFEPFTSTELDLSPNTTRTIASVSSQTEWDHGIVWSGSESAGHGNHANGYLEGAVESGHRATTILASHLDRLQK